MPAAPATLKDVNLELGSQACPLSSPMSTLPGQLFQESSGESIHFKQVRQHRPEPHRRHSGAGERGNSCVVRRRIGGRGGCTRPWGEDVDPGR